MKEFFNMGGYAIYVWPSYILTLLVLFFNIYLPRRKHKMLLRKLKLRQQREH